MLTVVQRTGDAAGLLGICGPATVGIWTIMATTRAMEVVLEGSTLTVSHHSTVDTFDLADPYRSVEIRGTLGSPSWSLALGRLDGSTVLVGSRTVDVVRLHRAVAYYRRKAENLQQDRAGRFDR